MADATAPTSTTPVRPDVAAGLARAVRLAERVCRIAGDHRLIDHVIRDLARRGVRAAVRQRDTAVLFEGC